MRKNYEANYIDVETWEFLLFSKVKCEFNYDKLKVMGLESEDDAKGIHKVHLTLPTQPARQWTWTK